MGVSCPQNSEGMLGGDRVSGQEVSPAEEPRASRLRLFEDPGAVLGEENLIPWSRVVERLEREWNFWLSTTRPDGRPHVTPLWGV